ncbi:NADH:flavin oxidoreductase/NADH oxidase family protein [Paenibacillus sp. NPDC057934]|uniref:NADH:flavin oxidoreductase/NADH oxidase family protein n=1 Tax=Paenibacillus sp. NPDC057934 TaxID=3346282 RepID=UPI0036DEC312
MTNLLNSPLTLPSGAVLSNRIAKGAMSEGLADAGNDSTPRLETLYRTWSASGAGLLLSGNVQVDRWHLERPNNVVLDENTNLAALAALAKAGTSSGNHFWVQLGHTGRQVSNLINPAPLAPSSVELELPRELGLTFAVPVEMTEEDIEKVIAQFVYAARKSREAGFTGVQLHAAHGYLFSQFLSPLTNRRTDRWGGSLENRARLLLTVISSIREVVGKEFPIGIKLNSSDFQKGGFTNAECIELVKLLNKTSLDLLELSGGSLEQPKVVGVTFKDEGVDGRRESTIKREAYFIEYAKAVREVAEMPVMVTGNFRTTAGMNEALDNGELDIVGIGRPFIADPLTAKHLLEGKLERALTPEDNINVIYTLPWFNMQLERLGDGLEPDLELEGPEAAVQFQQIESQNYASILKHRSQR